jgi:CDP-diacylglycerol---glycerol-3-phosphate 3-phosphatidyltransferase
MDSFRRQVPNFLSISRVPASALFLLVFSVSDPLGFWIAVFIAVGALITDFADGYLARRWKVVSEAGYFLDGLGDKCFTIAFCLVISRIMPSMLFTVWALISRELLLYGLRAIDPSKAHNMNRLRWISLVQAASIRISFGLCLLLAAFQVHSFYNPQLLPILVHVTAATAAIFGWASVILLGLTLAKKTSDTP